MDSSEDTGFTVIEASDVLLDRLPKLSSLLSACKCPVCYETMTNPVMTTTGCGHNFCSICVRRYLVYKQQCPACFQALHDTELQSNRSMKNVIDALVNLVQDLETLATSTSKITSSHVDVDNVPQSIPTSTSKIKSSHEDVENVPQPLPTSTSKIKSSHVTDVEKDVPQPLPSTSRNSPRVESTDEIRGQTERVDCPVCSVQVPQKNINLHLDRCLAEQSGQIGANNMPPNSPVTFNKNNMKPMQKVVYHLLKEADLRKRLKAEGLDTKGDKKALVARHQKFVVLWNSQCDVDRPMSRLEMVMRVKKEEQNTLNGSLATASPVTQTLLNYNRNTDPAVIDTKQKAYVNKNKTTFERLIAQAKKRKNKEKEPPNSTMTKSNDGDLQVLPTTHSPDKTQSDEDMFNSTSSGPALLNSSRSNMTTELDELDINKSPGVKAVPSGMLYVTPKRKSLADLLEEQSPKKRLKQQALNMASPQKPAVQKAQCPVCSVMVAPNSINGHLDKCLNKRETKHEMSDSEDDFDVNLLCTTPDIVEENSPTFQGSQVGKENSRLSKTRRVGKRMERTSRPNLRTRSNTNKKHLSQTQEADEGS